MADRIFVPLATAPFRRFQRGTKRVEVRAAGSPVARSVLSHDAGTPVLLRRGYSTPDELHGRLGRVWTAPSIDALTPDVRLLADLDGYALTGMYFDPEAAVVAFEVEGLPTVGVEEEA